MKWLEEEGDGAEGIDWLATCGILASGWVVADWVVASAVERGAEEQHTTMIGGWKAMR